MKKALLLLAAATLVGLTGLALAGSPSVSVNGSASAQSYVQVTIPKYVMLRVQAATSGSTGYATFTDPGVVSFDFTTTDGVSAYESALSSGSAIAWDGTKNFATTNLAAVQVKTNSGSGAKVQVKASASPSNVMPVSDVEINGVTLSSTDQTLYSSLGPGTPYAWQDVATPSMFSILPDAAATPLTTVTYTITYTATAN